MPKVTRDTLTNDCSALSNDRAILWRVDLAERMEAHDIPYLSTGTIKIRSKTSPQSMVATAYHLPNGTVFVWRVKHQLLSTTGMRNRYWNCIAKLPWTGADYYPFADKTGVA